MAITITNQISGTFPAYNDMIMIVTSDKTNQPNFKFVMDVYINGSSTKAFRETRPPDPIYSCGQFNASRTIENYVSSNFDIDISTVYRAADSIGTVTFKFGEEYGLSSSGTTVYSNLATSNTTIFWNGIFDHEDWCNFDTTRYRSQNSSSIFLTNSPANKKVYTNEKEYLYAINRTSGDIYYFQVICNDSAGSTIGVYRIYNSYQAITSYMDRMVRCPAGWNMNDISASDITVLTGSLPILTSSVSSYAIQCVRYSGTATTQQKVYTVDSDCSRFTKYRFHFLNKLGGYDSFSFTKKNKWVSDIKRENYKKNIGELTSSSSYDTLASQRGVTQYSTSIEDKITVKSDYLSSGDIAWLEELVTSPDVYVERNGKAVPVTIIDSSFERHNGEDKKLFNLSIDFKFSYKRNRQRF